MPPHNERFLAGTRRFAYRQVILTAQAFARIEASSGIVLMVAAVAALVWANSPWGNSYFELWHTHMSVDAELVHIDLDLQEWVNDGLMVLFFFLMGLEIKRELVHGELSSIRRAALPAAAALGGMAMPALIYIAFNVGGEGSSGWGVPMATDIAFALGVLSLLSSRVPFGLRVFLLAVAIADDIGAIVVIALFYTANIDALALAFAGVVLLGLMLMNRIGVRSVDLYVGAGMLLWVMMLESGIHATLTGVALGLLTPASSYYGSGTFADAAEDLVRRFREAEEKGVESLKGSILNQMEDLAQGSESPLERLEAKLHNWVSFLIVPLFALANAGVEVSGEVASAALESPVSHGVIAGLVLGKPLGIFLFTFVAVRLRLCDMPAGATWSQILGVGMLGGIGFTVALLITDLGFDSTLLTDEAKIGVLCASAVAGLAGFVFLFLATKEPTTGEPSTE